MASQTNPRIKCHYCSKEIIHRKFFSHLHSQHHSDFWTPCNKKSVERAIAAGMTREFSLEVKGYEMPFYFSPFSQRLYNKRATAQTDIAKHKDEKTQFTTLLSSLLSSPPAEKKVVTQVSVITPENKIDSLALQKMIVKLFSLVKSQRSKIDLLEKKTEWLKEIVVGAELKEEDDIDDFFEDDDTEDTSLATDPLTKHDFKRLTGLTLKDFEDAGAKAYEQTEVKPAPKPVEKPQPKEEPVPLPAVVPEAPVPEPKPEPPAPVTAPELVPLPKPEPLAALPAIDPVPVAPAPAAPAVLKKPPRQAVSYNQFVYREPQPQFPKILQTSKRIIST
jgi:hypothetical protein